MYIGVYMRMRTAKNYSQACHIRRFLDWVSGTKLRGQLYAYTAGTGYIRSRLQGPVILLKLNRGSLKQPPVVAAESDHPLTYDGQHAGLVDGAATVASERLDAPSLAWDISNWRGTA